MARIGKDVSERLDVIPAQFRVLVTRRPKYACRCCSQAVAQAHAPEHVVPGGLPTELFIAWIIVAKFGDHLPFYRQAEIFKRQGIHLDRGTLGNWVGRACFHLMPVINHMRAHLRGADRIFVDETCAPVLDPGRKATKSGFFWAVVSDDRGHGGAGPPIIQFHYAPGRGKAPPLNFLAGYRGRFLQCDAYQSYNALTEIARDNEGDTSVRDQITGLYDVARGRTFWTIAPVSFLMQGAWIAYQGLWAGEWLREIGGKSDSAAAAILTALALGVVVGQIGLGFLADRFARSATAFFRLTAVVSGLFIVTQLALLFHPEGYSGILWAAYGVLTAGAIFGYALLTRLVPLSASGSAISLLNFFAVLCGALIQGVVGFIVTAWPAGGFGWSGHEMALAALVFLQVASLFWMLWGGRPLLAGPDPPGEY